MKKTLAIASALDGKGERINQHLDNNAVKHIAKHH
jgi:hypothetical protein